MKKILGWVAAGMFAMSLSARADLIYDDLVLQDGLNDYSGTRDVVLHETGGTWNYGTADTLRVRYHTSSERTSLIDFDLAGVPTHLPGFELISATLSLYNRGHSTFFTSTNHVGGVYRMLVPWVEGTHDGATSTAANPGATKDYADYNNGNQSWASQCVFGSASSGTDRAVNATDTVSIPGTTASWTAGWRDWDVTADVSAWLGLAGDPVDQHGWLMLALSGGTSQYYYHSREYADDATLRPKLTLSYSIIPEPSTVGLLGMAGVLLLRARRRQSDL